jgi:hypothetical protein
MVKFTHMQEGVFDTVKTLDPDWQQHYRAAACVITQQYSSATFSSLNFHTRNKNCGRP